MTSRARHWLLAATVVLVGLAVGTAAAAAPYYSIKKSGSWYWSLNLAQTVFPPPDYRASHPSSSSLTGGLGLTPDEVRELRSQLSQVALSPLGPERSVALHDGSVVLQAACRGLSPSTASPQANVDLYHRFRCVLDDATYTRLATFKKAVAQARAVVVAATDPKPQAALNALVTAYAKLGRYETFGDQKTVRVTVTASGRRTYKIGVAP